MNHEKISISMPPDLLAQLDGRGRRADLSRSQVIADLLRAGLNAEPRVQQLEVRIRELESRPKTPIASHLSADFLKNDRRGTDRLKQNLSMVERQLAEARSEVVHLQAWSNSHERAAKTAQDEVVRLEGRLSEQQELQARLEVEIALEKDRKVPWHVRVPVAIILPQILRPKLERPNLQSFAAGVCTAMTAAALAMLVISYESGVMRAVATAAMGTWGDVPAAAARLHGGPLGGRGTVLQIYALANAGRNPARLDACFERSRKLSANDTLKAIDCSIKVPAEFELYATVVSSGPHAKTSRGKRTLDAAQRQLAAVERLNRQDR